jgi:hypothetical protein
MGRYKLRGCKPRLQFDVDCTPVRNNGAAAELYGTFGQSKRYRATGNAT